MNSIERRKDEWGAVLKPVVARYQGKVSRIYFRADAGFANQMAEVALPRQMFQEILRLIAELRPQPPPAPA